MTSKKLANTEWQSFFDRVSKGLAGTRAEIEIASLALGDQVVAEWLPLIGLVYDPKSDAIEVALEGLDHIIRKPRDVYVDEMAGQLASLAVIDAEGTEQIVRLRQPLALPAPQH